jgi:tRNA1(Val) A37 N6-methylase TrmN6
MRASGCCETSNATLTRERRDSSCYERHAMPVETAFQVSEDAILGGRLVLLQPLKGHRVGHDASLLAAACAAHRGEHLVDLGAGVGAAGLAVARRIEDLSVSLVEIDSQLAGLARDNIARNGFSERVRAVCLDVAAAPAVFAAAKLGLGSADRVLMNPPFNTAQNPSPDGGRRLAHSATDDTLATWLAAAARLLRPGGTLTLIWRADGLGEALAAAVAADFGAVTVLPVHPKPDAAAIRVLIRAVKASRAALALLPGFILADALARPTTETEKVLREGAVLPLAEN